VDHREHTAHDTLGREGWREAPWSGLRLALFDNCSQLLKHTGSVLKDPRPGPQRVHEDKRSDRGLMFQKPKQRLKSSPYALRPAALTFIGWSHDAGHLSKGLIERREETVFAAFEVRIEGFARDAGATDYERH